MRDIRGAGGGGGGGGKDGGSGGQSRTPVEAPNSLFSVAFANILFLLSEGEVEGFPNSDQQDIHLDGTPIRRVTQLAPGQQEESQINFQNVTLQYRSGTDPQTPLSGYQQIGNTISVGTAVTQTIGPITRTITDPDVERCRVIIQHPSLQSINSSTGDTNPTTVQYRISVSANGGPYVAQGSDPITVSGKSSGQFQRAYEFALTGSAPWSIRVERITADSTTSFLSNEIIWQAYTEIIDERLSYPNSAVLGMRVDARQFRSIPNVTVRLKGRRVQVPSNYNPTTRTYTGLWNGTWQTAWTDNPAWIFRDLVVNPRFGLRRYLPSADCDPWTLYAISQYCDERVPNGAGGTEPRFRCNVYLQNEGGVFEVLNALASTFRGIIHYANGKIVLTQDRPATPAQQFSEANVLQDVDESGRITTPAFVYQGTSRTARKSVVLASWDDPAQNYNQVAEYLQDDELLRKFGYNPTDLRLLGVTSRGQALRAAKFVLYNNRYALEKISFRVGAEGLASGIGDVIQVADPLRQGQRLGGRIRAVSGTTITLDATPEQLAAIPGTTYTVTLVNPNGATVTNPDGSSGIEPGLTTYTVSGWGTAASGHVTLTLNSSPSVQPGSLWVLEWNSMQASLYRIISISETEPFIFQIEALPYSDSAYSYIDNDLPVVTPKDRFAIRDTQPPTGLTARLDYHNGAVRILADWTAPQVNGIDDPQVFEYRYQYRQVGSEQWIGRPDTSYTDSDIPLLQYTWGMQFQFRVASRNRLGQQSNWVQVNVADFGLLPDISLSAYGASVSHVNQPDGSQLIIINSGRVPLPERISGYRIWAKPGNDLVGTIPGVKDPEADGYYRLNDVPLTGYYAVSFHAPATYTVRVALLSAVPGEGAGTTYLYDTVARAEIVPPQLERFTVVQAQGSTGKRFSWQVPVPVSGAWDRGIVSDISAFEVRYKQGELGTLTPAQAWSVGLPLFSGGVPSTQNWFETSLFDNDTWIVMIKAVDMTGWSSDDPAYIVVNTQSPRLSNIVVSAAMNLADVRTELVNCTTTTNTYLALEAGGLLLQENGDSLILDQPAAPYLIQTDTSSDAYVTFVFDNDRIDSELLLTTSASATYQHYIRSLSGLELPIQMESGDDILLENGSALTIEGSYYDYTGLQTSSIASSVWHPYAPLERLIEDEYAIRTLFRSVDGTTPAELYSTTYQLDYRDLFESFNDVVTSAGADTTVALTRPFRAVTGTQATLQADGGTAVSVIIISRSKTQVVLKTVNSAGVRVAGLVDLTVQGY